MELTNRRTIYVDQQWYEQLEAYLGPGPVLADPLMPFNSVRFVTPDGTVVVFTLKKDSND